MINITLETTDRLKHDSVVVVSDETPNERYLIAFGIKASVNFVTHKLKEYFLPQDKTTTILIHKTGHA